jgi:hypothetical protein
MTWQRHWVERKSNEENQARRRNEIISANIEKAVAVNVNPG